MRWNSSSAPADRSLELTSCRDPAKKPSFRKTPLGFGRCAMSWKQTYAIPNRPPNGPIRRDCAQVPAFLRERVSLAPASFLFQEPVGFPPPAQLVLLWAKARGLLCLGSSCFGALVVGLPALSVGAAGGTTSVLACRCSVALRIVSLISFTRNCCAGVRGFAGSVSGVCDICAMGCCFTADRLLMKSRNAMIFAFGQGRSCPPRP